MSLEKRINILIETANRDKKIVDELINKEEFFKSLIRFEYYYVARKILEKNIFLREQLIKDSSNLLLNFSTLRFIIETLIHARSSDDFPGQTQN